MPVCEMCTASYDDAFKFCPYCGRARPEPEVAYIDVRVTEAAYEEATLEIELIEKRLLSEKPFDWRPNILRKALGDAGRNWQEIGIYRLTLNAIHPVKGHYSPFRSSTFRAFQVPGRESFALPTIIELDLDRTEAGREWLRKLLQERYSAWSDLNEYLIRDGWHGITSQAAKRGPPFLIDFDIPPLRDGSWLKVNERSILGSLSRDGFLEIGMEWDLPAYKPDYRYQRPARP